MPPDASESHSHGSSSVPRPGRVPDSVPSASGSIPVPDSGPNAHPRATESEPVPKPKQAPSSAGPARDPQSRGAATAATAANSSAPTSDTTPGIRHWGRVYAVVLAFLALLIALFAWLTTIYS